jgi:hypothetical protein
VSKPAAFAWFQTLSPLRAAAFAPRKLLEAWAASWVVSKSRPYFEDLAREYGACSAEERCAVEAEVRKNLEEMEVTDDQWRRHEELWERLRASLPS